MKEALKLALDALENHTAIKHPQQIHYRDKAINAIKEALTQPDPYTKGYADAMNWKTANHLEHLPAAQPEQEPVAWFTATPIEGNGNRVLYEQVSKQYNGTPDTIPLYTTPPQRKPLTDEQIIASNYPDGEENGPTIAAPDFELICFARQIEAAHGIKE